MQVVFGQMLLWRKACSVVWVGWSRSTGNAGVGHAVLAREMDSVHAASPKCLTLYAAGGEEIGCLSALLFLEKSPKDLYASSACFEFNKYISCTYAPGAVQTAVSMP